MWYAPTFNKVFFNHSEIRAFYVGGDDGRPFIIFPQNIRDDHLAFIDVWPLNYEVPMVEDDQIAEPTNVVQIDGQWVQQWNIRDRTPEEMPDPEPEPEDPPVDPDPEEPVQSGN